MPTQPDSSSSAKGAIFIYAALMVGAIAIALDFASVDLALPAMERQFGLDLEGVQWVINGYVLAFSVLMVTGGKLADAYGRKLIFLVGMGIFALASLLGGMAWSGGSVIGFRVLQGVGAALLWPAMIGMACGAFGDAKRAFILGLIFGSCSLGNAAGPIVGGALTEWLSWRWVLLVNVPLALFAMLITFLAVPWDKSLAERPRNDYPGMISLTGGLVMLMLFVYQGPSFGWLDPRTIGLGAGAVILLGMFPWLEIRAKEALVPLFLMRSKEFMTLCFSVIAICQLFFIVLLYVTQYALKFLQDDPVAGGARVAQFMLAYGVVSYFGGPLVSYFGSRFLLLAGTMAAVFAAVLLGFCGPGGEWMLFNFSLILMGVGVGLVIPTVNARAIESAGSERAGLVSGVTFMCQLSGSALMLALNTALFSVVSWSTLDRLLGAKDIILSAPQQQIAGAILTGAATAHAIPMHTVAEAAEISDILNLSYQTGLQWLMWLGAILLIFAWFLIWIFVPNRAATKE